MYLGDAHEAAYFGPCSEIACTLSGVSDEGAVVGKLVFGPDYLRGDWAWAYLLAASQDLAEVFVWLNYHRDCCGRWGHTSSPPDAACCSCPLARSRLHSCRA